MELKWRLNATPSGGHVDPAYPLYVGGIYQQVKTDYPFQEKLPAADFPDEMTPHVVKYRFRPGAEKWPVVQIGPGVASFNMVGEYDWDSFRAGATACWRALDAAYEAAAGSAGPPYTQFLLRYINAVRIDESVDPVEFVSRKLGLQVAIPIDISKLSSGPPGVVNFSIGYPLRYPGATGALNIGLGEVRGSRAIIWDMTITANVDRDRNAVADFESWIEVAHEVIEQWFFTLIAGDLEQQFRSGGRD